MAWLLYSLIYVCPSVGMNERSGILWDKTMADKLMYIINDDIQNYPFCKYLLDVETDLWKNIPQSKNSCPK